MTRGQLITDLKNMIGPGIEVDDSGLATWVNDAYMQIVDEIKQVNPDFFTKSATTSSVNGQQEYALPSDFEQVLMVNIQLDGNWQRVLPIERINDIPIVARTDSNQGWSNSEPGYYVIGSNIGFMPIPDETTSNNIKLWYTYTPSELSSDANTPAIPGKFHHIIKYGAYANYLDQDDEHVAAERMRQRFEVRIHKMLESMHDNHLEAGKSVVMTGNRDLYVDDDGWF